MTTIQIRTIDTVLSATILPTISSGNQNTIRVKFVYDSFWGDGYAKSAVFFTDKNKTPYESIVSSDGICTVPAETLVEAGHLYIGLKGVYGRQVKTSKLLKLKISQGTPNVVMSDPTDDVYAQLLSAYYEMGTELKVERARINQILDADSPADYDETYDELSDIRIGYDGITYGSAGDAVREQLGALDNALNAYIDYVYERVNIVSPTLVSGFVRYTNGEISNDSFDGFYKRTDYIALPKYCNEILHNFDFGVGGTGGYAFFDVLKQFISGGQTLEKIVNIPSEARYFMITSYDNTLQHTGKAITIKTKSVNVGTVDIHKLVTFGDSHIARGGWQDEVISYFGIESHTNLGVGSSSVAENASATKPPFVDSARIEEIKAADPDTIIIIGGTNDVHLDVPLGTNAEFKKTIDSKDKTTFFGAYSYLIETLLTWKPTLKIVICTIPQGYYDNMHTIKYFDISTVIREIGEYYSLPICDIFSKCGINKINLSTYSDDLIHYNNLGNERISKLMIDTLKAI